MKKITLFLMTLALLTSCAKTELIKQDYLELPVQVKVVGVDQDGKVSESPIILVR